MDKKGRRPASFVLSEFDADTVEAVPGSPTQDRININGKKTDADP